MQPRRDPLPLDGPNAFITHSPMCQPKKDKVNKYYKALTMLPWLSKGITKETLFSYFVA